MTGEKYALSAVKRKIHGSVLPHFPGSFALRPYIFQQSLFAHGVHALPEALVLVGHELAILRGALQRRLFQDGIIAVDIVEELRLADHEPDVDEVAVALRFLAKFADAALVVNIEHAEALTGVIGRDGDKLAVRPMEREQLLEIHVGNAVAVSKHERLIADVLLHALHTAAGHGVEAGIHHRNAPRLGMVLVDNHLVFAVGEVICNVGGVQEIIRKILLDHMLLIPGADHKIVEAVITVELHDMPEDRHAAQIHHGLWFKLAFFGDSCSEAAGKNNNFHRISSLSTF